MNKHGSKGQRVVDLDDVILGHRLRAADLKTRLRYIQCDAMHIAALKGHPLYQDASVSSQETRPC